MAGERNDFIRDIIDEDLRTGRHQRVATRFPPEPNGYLHIGHAKSICLNFGLARDYEGTCNLRYDDTNPAKEDVEYVTSIEHDVRWLGFAPTDVLFSADYFPRMYELAEKLVREGKAYVCDLSDEETRATRGTLSEPGTPSPFRARTVDENLAKLRVMKSGALADGACTLRAKIDMASANMKMRDPLLYRIRHAHHHRTGDQWCIYPMYDWAHPIEDAIEGITHSICTLEFENNRELYDWVIAETGISAGTVAPRQYEFARLVLDYTVMSKRKLLTLVTGGHVNGWDDPRMPTLAGMRRRGYAPEAIRAFCEMIGVAKANSSVDIGKLEYCVRAELNDNAPRALGVLRPIEITLDGALEATSVAAPRFPPDSGKGGTRDLALGGVIYIERDDWRDAVEPGYQRLAPGRTVRLRFGPCITAGEVTARDGSGAVTAMRATVVAGTAGGKNPIDGTKVSGVIHWVDAATSVRAEVRLYDRLFGVAKPEDGGADFLTHMSPRSLEVVRDARVEASLGGEAVGTRWQLERVGYFRVDEDSRPSALVLNRIATLRDERVAVVAAVTEPAGEREKNAKAKTRPKSKSPHEYRAEARVRDPELAAAYAAFEALGLTAEQADLLSGDRATADRFRLAAVDGRAELAAKWFVNELPRALGDRELEAVDGAQLADFIGAIGDNKLSPTAAKSVLAELVTGKSLAELMANLPASGAAVDVDAATQKVIDANPEKAAQYRAGKTGLLGFFVGQVMKAAPNADAAAVNAAVRARLA